MPLSRTDWTADMLDALPEDGNRYEVIDGELFVTPAPTDIHQGAVTELLLLLAPYGKLLGINVLGAPSAVRFSDRREVQPDVLAKSYPKKGMVTGRQTARGSLLLAVEILSPSTMRTDRFRKRALYQQENVADYWVVDTAMRMFEQWTPDAIEPDYQSKEIVWHPVPTHPPLIIDVEQYFNEVFREL